MKFRYKLWIAPGIEYDAVGEADLQLKTGCAVVVHCERYEEFGEVTAAYDGEPVDEAALAREAVEQEKGRRVQGQTVPAVRRIATPADVNQRRENDQREDSIYRTVAQKIRDHRLEMKVINIHLVFDRSLLVVQFTADGRVDFRELLRDLSKALHLRVELRQIGVRDETAIHGGLGCCGRPFCCAMFLTDFQSINVKLAKEQGLSLNPANISGACGRLKCCLRYEADGYREMRRHLPRSGAQVETPEGPGKVVELMPLKNQVRVLLHPADGLGPRLAEFAAADVRLRQGEPAGRDEADDEAGEHHPPNGRRHG